MIRVGFVGVPGTGKTSLARSVTSKCRTLPGMNRVELVSEYARRYLSKHNSIDHIWEQYRVMEKQIEWEDSVLSDHTDILITDSPIHLGFMYACQLVNNDPKNIMIYNDIFKKLSKLNEHKPRYDIIFHLPPVISPVNDGVRADYQFDPTWRSYADFQLKNIFNSIFKCGLFYTIDAVDMKERCEFCIERIKQL